MAAKSPQIRTFMKLMKTVPGYITNSLDGLCMEAIGMDLMTFQEKGGIEAGGVSNHVKCSRFLEHFYLRIEKDPPVLDQFINMLSTLSTCDGLVKQYSRYLS
jgi:hypothetical protein